MDPAEYKKQKQCVGDVSTENKAYLISRNTEPTPRRIKREPRARNKEEPKRRKREEEENQSETGISLQSIFVSELFRISNQESRSTKTKDETIL